MQAVKLREEKEKVEFDAEHLVKGNKCIFYLA